MENKDLTIGRASYIYLITVVLLLVSSSVSSMVFGFAWSLWVSQGVFLAIAAFLAWKNKWSPRDVYRFRGMGVGTAVAAFVTGLGLWWGGLAFNIWSERLVTRLFGSQPDLGIEFSALDPFILIIALVILAPIIEEILFRGYFLRAFESQTRKPWLWSGLMFGLIHIGNGLSSTIPAIIYGLVFGYIVWRSGSIFAGMLAHVGVNINAVFMGGVFQGFVNTPNFSPDLIVLSGIGLAVLALALLWFRHLQRHKPVPPGPEQVVSLRGLQWGALALTGIVLLSLGVLDAQIRVSAHDKIQDYTRITAGSFTGDMRFGEIEVAEAPVTLLLSYQLTSDVLDAVLGVTAPDGSIVWSQEYKDSWDIYAESANPVEIVLDMAGTWHISLNGSGEGLKFDADWEIVR